MISANCQEIWRDGPNGQRLCAMINGERGWLMYLRHPDDAGFSSRNADYVGPSDEDIEYELVNGQIDCYPASWAYAASTVMEALNYFESEGLLPPFIVWHNDSDDGTAPPAKPNTSFNSDALKRAG